RALRARGLRWAPTLVTACTALGSRNVRARSCTVKRAHAGPTLCTCRGMTLRPGPEGAELARGGPSLRSRLARTGKMAACLEISLGNNLRRTGHPGGLPDRVAQLCRHREPRHGLEGPAQLWQQEPRCDQCAALRQQGRGRGHAGARRLEGLAARGAGALVRLAAFVGHVWPVFFRFQGGKGVATALGVLLGISWILGLATAATWLIIAVFFRYSSLASLVAAAFAPAYYVLASGAAWYADPSISTAIFAMAILLAWRHRLNIGRLIQGKESRLGAKKSKSHQ